VPWQCDSQHQQGLQGRTQHGVATYKQQPSQADEHSCWAEAKIAHQQKLRRGEPVHIHACHGADQLLLTQGFLFLRQAPGKQHASTAL
jgi:hypothetical protein